MIMAKKNKLPVSIFELVWYPICALVILWGLTYVILGLVTKYNNISALTEFNTNFTKQFGLNLYFWGLIIVVIGVIAGVAVMLIFAKTFDRATEREQRRSARLNALKKDDEKVVAEQPAEVVEPKAE
jgi:type II secretory pathway component PulF